jgi:hypothetical protein
VGSAISIGAAVLRFLVVIMFPLGPPARDVRQGVAVAIVSVARNSPAPIDPAVKSNYPAAYSPSASAPSLSLRGHPLGDGSVAEG